MYNQRFTSLQLQSSQSQQPEVRIMMHYVTLGAHKNVGHRRNCRQHTRCTLLSFISRISFSELSSRSDISDAKSASTASFLSALVFNSAVFAVQIGVFTLLRPYFKSIYEPRTYVPPPEYVVFQWMHLVFICFLGNA